MKKTHHILGAVHRGVWGTSPCGLSVLLGTDQRGPAAMFYAAANRCHSGRKRLHKAPPRC
jgi:hypothetical protein